jgi:hypothetical protein
MIENQKKILMIFRRKPPKKKGIRQRKREKKILFNFRVLRLPEKERALYLKHSRTMQRYAKLGQLRHGEYYCKMGLLINYARVEKYESMCHYMVQKFVPARSLWEASCNYDDLTNRARFEVFKALLNGFNPRKVVRGEPTPEDICKLEKSTIYGRLRSFLKRELYNHHPDQRGGRSISIENILVGVNSNVSSSFQNQLVSDFESQEDLDKTKEELLYILETQGADVARSAFFQLDERSREMVSDYLFNLDPSRGMASLPTEEDCDGIRGHYCEISSSGIA